MATPLDNAQIDAILEEISKGNRVPCSDGCCTGALGVDGNCSTCGKNFKKQNEIEKMKVILSIAEERGQDVTELFDSLEFTAEMKTVLKKLAQELRVIKFAEEIYKNEINKHKKLKDNTGFKRLSIFIPAICFFVLYVSLALNERSLSEEEVFIVFPIISGLAALSVYILLRTIYWIVDGFRKEKAS